MFYILSRTDGNTNWHWDNDIEITKEYDVNIYITADNRQQNARRSATPSILTLLC